MKISSSHRSASLWVDTLHISKHQLDIVASPISPVRIDISFSRTAGISKMTYSDAHMFMLAIKDFIADAVIDGQLFSDKTSKMYEIQLIEYSGRHLGLYSRLVARWTNQVLANKFLLQNVVVTNTSLVIFIQRT